MPLWRCPHCGTPQAETARCWVCHRSSTSCGTCRNFRASVAAGVGYCGLDRKRLPLRGDEIRVCWEDARGAAQPQPTDDASDWLPDPEPVEPPPDAPVALPVLAPTGGHAVSGSARLWVEVEA